uniref:Uncharacterized protein n=1 Tax=Physcomitrium patens TaxID=3218 RepID=A0A2K1L0K4_PHYPA|nr:hypothetical protein PHYPA_002349 [Physcomitrium patens]
MSQSDAVSTPAAKHALTNSPQTLQCRRSRSLLKPATDDLLELGFEGLKICGCRLFVLWGGGLVQCRVFDS